jgi:hypothetical protein
MILKVLHESTSTEPIHLPQIWQQQ